VNKYLHTVASVGFLFTLNYDARNHELKKKVLNSNYGLQVNAATVKQLDSDGPEVMFGRIPK